MVQRKDHECTQRRHVRYSIRGRRYGEACKETLGSTFEELVLLKKESVDRNLATVMTTSQRG